MKLKSFFLLLAIVPVVIAKSQTWSVSSSGYTWNAPGGKWVPSLQRYEQNTTGPKSPWTLTPRTGLIDHVFANDDNTTNTGTDSIFTRISSQYYITERIKGYWEYLPEGYNDDGNTQTYPLIIYMPGCGEVHDGRFYMHPAITSGSNQRPAIPNFEFGLGRLMKKGDPVSVSNWTVNRVQQDRNGTNPFPTTNYSNNNFNSLPRELMRNGDYFSNIPVKTPGQTYNYSTGTKRGVIVMALNLDGHPVICGRVNQPLIGDIAGAITTAIRLYRVDISRIYLTGMSYGGGISYSFPASSLANARKIAAIVPVAASAAIDAQPIEEYMNIVNGGVSVFPITNALDSGANNPISDNRVTMNRFRDIPGSKIDSAFFYYADQLDAQGKPKIGWQYSTSFWRHNAWTYAYSTRYQKSGQFVADWYPYTDPISNEKYTVYEWMLTKQNLSLLPVSVVSFVAQRVNNGVNLSWVTEQEVNSDLFILERSVNGKDFSALTTMKAAGNSTIRKQYGYLDANLPDAMYVYYRLSQRDKNGQLQIIGVKKVFLGAQGFEISVYPSVVTSTVNVEVQGLVNEQLTVRVMDLTGRQLQQHVIAPRQNRLTINTDKLSKGMYIVQVNGTGKNQTTKFIKQ
jgi:hypothetical protein